MGLVEDEAGAAALYPALHTPLAAAGVDGVKVCCDPGCSRPASRRLPTPRSPALPACSPIPHTPQKVDVQSGVAAMGGGMGGGPELTRKYTRALEASVEEHFPSNGCINCMCHSTESLYRYRTTAVARASDDFYPDRPESHTVHPRSRCYRPLHACTALHQHAQIPVHACAT